MIIALSLAALPIGATATATPLVVQSSSAHAHAMHDGMHASMHQPCHHSADVGHPSQSPAPSHHKCPLGLCCVGASVAFDQVTPVAVTFFARITDHVAAPADAFVPDHAGAPPYRPPRV